MYIEQKIPLVTALTGGEFEIVHLDGRKLKVTIQPGNVVKPGEIKTIKGEGMPTYRNPFEKGNLNVIFSIQFPENNWIPQSDLKKIAKVSFFFFFFCFYYHPFHFF